MLGALWLKAEALAAGPVAASPDLRIGMTASLTTWRLSPLTGNYVTPVPAQMRRGPRWYAGSADAISA